MVILNNVYTLCDTVVEALCNLWRPHECHQDFVHVDPRCVPFEQLVRADYCSSIGSSSLASAVVSSEGSPLVRFAFRPWTPSKELSAIVFRKPKHIPPLSANGLAYSLNHSSESQTSPSQRSTNEEWMEYTYQLCSPVVE
jgi:hypothetical protein